RCTISLVIRKMQIKPTKRYHFTPIRLENIKPSDNANCWQELTHGWGREGGCKSEQPFGGATWQFLVEIKIRISLHLEILLLSIYLENSCICAPGDVYKTWKQSTCPS
ncbi:LORF2 protein, partial [Crocuta crocuta]